MTKSSLDKLNIELINDLEIIEDILVSSLNAVKTVYLDPFILELKTLIEKDIKNKRTWYVYDFNDTNDDFIIRERSLVIEKSWGDTWKASFIISLSFLYDKSDKKNFKGFKLIVFNEKPEKYKIFSEDLYIMLQEKFPELNFNYDIEYLELKLDWKDYKKISSFLVLIKKIVIEYLIKELNGKTFYILK